MSTWRLSTRIVSAMVLVLSSGLAIAQPAEKEPVAILEFGGATNWNIRGGAATFGPSVAVEVTPIENWLELEAGTTPFITRNSTEWDTDLLFKKPWTLSKGAEFMAGVCPERIHAKQNGLATDAIAAEAVADFMFWPKGRQRFGWYFEPAFDHSFGPGNEQSVGASAGLLIAIP